MGRLERFTLPYVATEPNKFSYVFGPCSISLKVEYLLYSFILQPIVLKVVQKLQILF